MTLKKIFPEGNLGLGAIKSNQKCDEGDSVPIGIEVILVSLCTFSDSICDSVCSYAYLQKPTEPSPNIHFSHQLAENRKFEARQTSANGKRRNSGAEYSLIRKVNIH